MPAAAVTTRTLPQTAFTLTRLRVRVSVYESGPDVNPIGPCSVKCEALTATAEMADRLG